MEQQPWPTKFQQSGASDLERTDTDMNNGNSSDNLLHIADNNSRNNESKCDKNARLQQKFENEISDESRTKIQAILSEVNILLPVEKLLLYLKLPTECKETADPLRQPLNPLGSRSEISQTIMWIKTHLEEDPDISLQKKGVYDEYKAYCDQNNIKNLSTADFGKVMKQVYPNVRPRRLGTRGNSQYCYSGLRKRIKLSAPLLPDLADKPQSTEPACYQSDLMAATWIIIKEWSECQLGFKFESTQALAYHLVTKSSIGIGTKAASIITADTERQMKETPTSCSSICISKHRETTLQLQRKIQQKNEVYKEQKRKLQSPKSEMKARNKKCKMQQQPSVSSSPTAASESNTSPSQGIQTICDKSLDFTNLQALPDFSSFQKPVSDMGAPCDVAAREDEGCSGSTTPTPKVAIPRLSAKQSPAPSPRRAKNAAKYKAIQPKPEPCDIAYNPQPTALAAAGDSRSQENGTKCKKQKPKKDDELYDVVTPLDEEQQPMLLSRERLISVSKVSKDALDDYLGTGNSQEHEEELMKYFENNNSQEEALEPDTKKLSQLRQLLEQNHQVNTVLQQQDMQQAGVRHNNASTKSAFKRASFLPKVAIPFNLQASGNARRRVSFDTQNHDDPVPPSPNTRRKNFSFTPISPGPQSPNGRQSKCSSTNASPFVSPRNTPVPRARGNSHPYTNPNPPIGLVSVATARSKLKNLKTIKSDLELAAYKPPTITMPMSAPPSPKTNLLQDLLNNKLPYQSDYAQQQQLQSSPEVGQLLANNVPEAPPEAYRSQSVPLRALPSAYFTHFSFDLTNEEPIVPQNEFNDIDSFSASENINVNKIIDSIDNTNLAMIEKDLINNDIDFCAAEPNPTIPISESEPFYKSTNQHNVRWMNRSQSFDYDESSVQNSSKCPPYRSVPSTPIPYCKPKIDPEKAYQISRSYPSTPLTGDTFGYNHQGHDYLLNGQPIKEKLPNQMSFLENKDLSKIYDIFPPHPNISSADSKGPFNFDGQMAEANFGGAKSINLEEGCDIIGADYFKGVPDVNGS